MLITRFKRAYSRILCMNFEGADDGSGASTGGGAIDSAPTPAPAPVAAPAAAPAGPATMLDAISASLDKSTPAGQAPAPAPTGGQPRDELGRFTFKDAQGNAVDAQGNPAPDQAAALAAQAAAAQTAQPAAEEDITQMPEGLGAKAQERFQKLANSNKELQAKYEQLEQQVMQPFQALQETFQSNGVQREQFDQAISVIGMLNRGDFAGAQKVLQEQLQMISAMTGQSLSIDPLAGHPDLRQQVDGLMMTEAAALEVARARMSTQAQQQQQQRAEQQRQQQEQEQQQNQRQQQALQAGTLAVDKLCKSLQASDVDYPVIEAQLVAVLPKLLKTMPPEHWENAVRTQYDLIKKVATQTRGTTPQGQGGTVLRATGQASPAAQPKTMFQAMFPNG